MRITSKKNIRVLSAIENDPVFHANSLSRFSGAQ
jgi:hypothetical protein